MMIRNNYSKSQIFLLEFIIVVLFFAICSTICISVFMKADTISKESSRDINAMVIAQNAAECFKASESADPEEYYDFDEIKNGRYIAYYDGKFDSTTKENAEYILKIDLYVTDESIISAKISVYEINEKTAFYKLNVDKYIGEQN